MRFYILISFILIALSANCQSKNPYADTLIIEGRELLNGNYIPEAKLKFKEAFDLERNPQTVTEYVQVLIKEQNFKEAYKIAFECQQNNPDEPVYSMIKGNVHSVKGEYREAIKELNKSIKLNPTKDQEKYYLYRAVAYEKNKDFDDALNDYKKSLDINPNQPEVYYYYGALNYRQENFNVAIDNLNKAIQYGYTNQYVYFARGMSYLGTKENVNACKDFRVACKDGNLDACKMIILHCTKK
ncbi:MAG: tetratricopeptide repeat protein [Bacteroidales bacterium]|nr:tetratricopeptide repeat protein [Bacteroidales bacterium]